MTSIPKQRQNASTMKKKMSKEQLQLALAKKRQCNARALMIVERLIETEVDQAWLLENLTHINRDHMDDVVEERAILKRCGYPLCDNQLKANISQRYHISTKSNKVYDVSRRKNFCSNNCYGAGNYISEQLLTSPLWLRDLKDKPVFQLLSVSKLAQNSMPGDEVDLGRENVILDPSRLSENSKDQAPATKSDTIKDDAKQEEVDNCTYKAELEKCKENIITPATDSRDLTLTADEPKFADKSVGLVFQRDVKLQRNISETVPNQNKPPKKLGKKKEINSNFDPNWLVKRIEYYLREWITLDSLVLLLGDTAIKKHKIDEMSRESAGVELQKKYIQLGQKINSLQIDPDSEEDEEKSKSDLKPLPNYEMLKEEGEKLKIKVKVFFEGRTSIETVASKSNEAAAQEADDSTTYSPLLGERDPKSLRRRIILEKLNKVLPEMMRTLAGGDFVVPDCIGSNGCGKAVKALVNTFSLSASNVNPKPAEWNLLSLVLIKLLSISEPRIRFLLNTERATKYVTMILMSYNLQSNYLETLVAALTNPDSYHKKEEKEDDN